ncbi:MAG: septal ring lytic transglycosylase RlpA family protein [Chitinophagaceae bacterium]|jgi:rare lipoprotein A (peptidoglycan hydrolase)|nr:septal ring lytic transglycosylase RlpA family protein [Chitinophagaceae bacterium]
MKYIAYISTILVLLWLGAGARVPAGWHRLPLTDTIPADTIQPVITDTVHTPDSLLTLLGKPIQGSASYYSPKFEGRRTASGMVFTHRGFTAASNHFPLHTRVKVTNLLNNKSVIVLINDRMHPRMKRKGRVVDLTRSAADSLDFLAAGLARVSVQPVEELKKIKWE